MVLVEAGHDAQVSAALRAVVLSLAAQDPAALVHRVPAEVAAERRARAHGGRVRRAERRHRGRAERERGLGTGPVQGAGAAAGCILLLHDAYGADQQRRVLLLLRWTGLQM